MVVVPLGQSAVGCPVAAGIDSLTAKSGVSKALTRCHVANGSPVRSSGGAGSSARSAAIARPFSCPASPIPKSARSSPSSGQRPLVSSAAPRASFSAGLRHRRHVSSCPSACGANPAEAALSSLSLRRVLPSCSSSRRESYLPLGSTARWLRGDPDAAIFRSSAPPSTGLLTSNSAGGLLTARAEAAAGTLTTSGGQGAPAAAVEIAIPAPAWEGAKPLPFLLSVGVGLAVRFLAPRPLAVSPAAWQLLAIFSSTITGLVLGPLPVGAWAFLGLTTAVLTKTLSFSAAFSAFSSDVIWLIVISFFFARGFVKTGLGDRVATYFVKWMGKSTLGLSYGLTMAEALIAPAMPSTTARAGGVFVPIIKSLSLSAGSKPNDPSSKKVGAYLMQSQLQAAGNSSALYLTAAAQNLLCLKLASELGVSLPSAWMSWFKAASVPALTALLTVPYLIYKLFPPEDKETPEAPRIAAEKLRKLGPVTKNEWIMVATMLVAVTLWVLGEAIGVASVTAAMLGLSLLLLTGVLTWEDCLNEKSAWDTLAWFAILVGMSGQLNSLGLVRFMSDSVGNSLASLTVGWPAAFGLLQGTYFIIHYMFASQTAHVGALYSAFLAMHIAAGVPAMLSALALAFSTNLFGSITHYSSGQGAVYYGAGYVTLPETFKLGAIMACWNMFVWIVVGGVWWKFLGLY